MYKKDIIKKFMRNILIESLGFIEMYKDSFPPDYDDYIDIKVDHKNKKWSTYARKVVNLRKWQKKNEMLSIPSVKDLVDYLSTAEGEDNQYYRDDIEPFYQSAIEEKLGNIPIYKILPIANAYINKFGTSFKESSFDYIFDAWYESFERPNSYRRIFVLRNLVLDGLDFIDLLGYRIRPLKNYEIKFLIAFGSYNQNATHYNFLNIPVSLTGDLNPEYCVEVPSQVFGETDERKSSEYIKNRLLGLLLTFKLKTVTMETELNYDIMSEFSIDYPGSLLTNYLEPHHYFSTPYVLILSDYDKLSKYERLYANIKLDDDKALNLAIRRFLMPIWRFEAEDIILDYMIALEALLSDSEQDIRYRISIRLAYLISDDPEERLRIAEIMGSIYNFRSHIVHGNAKGLSKAKLKLEKSLQSKLEDEYAAEHILKEYVRLTIQGYVIFSSKINCRNCKEAYLENLEQKILGIK